MEIEYAFVPARDVHEAGKVAGDDFDKKRGNIAAVEGAAVSILPVAAEQGMDTAVAIFVRPW